MLTMYYIGLDVHKRKISYCVKDSSGKVYAEGSLPATRIDLDHWMKTLPQPWSAAMEATMFTGWIYDHLKPHAAALKVGHPLMLRAIAAAKKDFTDWREIPPAALERKGLRDALQQALASLSQNCREVFFLRDIAHLSTDETAQVLEIAVGTVKTRLLTARLQMRDALAPGFNSSWLKGGSGVNFLRC